MIIYIRRQQTGEEHAVVAQHNPWFDWSSIRGGSGNATTCCLGAGEYSTACTRHKYTHIHTHSVGVIRIWRLAAQCNLSANHEENKRLSRAAGLIDALSTLLLSTADDAVRVCFRLHVCNRLCVQCFLVLVFRPHKYCKRLGNLSHVRLLEIEWAHVAHTYMRKHTLCTSFASNTHSAHAHTPWPSLPFSFLSAPKTLQSAAAGGLYNLVTAADREGEKFRIIWISISWFFSLSFLELTCQYFGSARASRCGWNYENSSHFSKYQSSLRHQGQGWKIW